jgi:hypothetical protein
MTRHLRLLVTAGVGVALLAAGAPALFASDRGDTARSTGFALTPDLERALAPPKLIELPNAASPPPDVSVSVDLSADPPNVVVDAPDEGTSVSVTTSEEPPAVSVTVETQNSSSGASGSVSTTATHSSSTANGSESVSHTSTSTSSGAGGNEVPDLPDFDLDLENPVPFGFDGL